MARLFVRFALFVTLTASQATAAMLEPGDAFPVWKLVDQTGNEISSEDYAGKTYLMWFYPKAMTPGCTTEGQGLRDRVDEFREKGVAIVGVSFDAPADNARFAEKHGFPFSLLSDRERTVAVAVGAADSPEQPVAKRISYLIGPEGAVLQAYGSVDPSSHAGEVLGDLPASP